MSRSIHGNRSWRAFEQKGYRDWVAIATKRAIKRSTHESRQRPSNASVHTLHVPRIDVSETGATYFFPASRDDVEGILRALPPSAIQGLNSIRLETGVHLERREDICPGVHSPQVFGTYSPDSNDIRVFAYSRSHDASLSHHQEQELRFAMFRTLVHEIAHHLDRTSRVNRGRWRMDDVKKAETYADKMAMTWCIEIVVRYLSERYGRPTDPAI